METVIAEYESLTAAEHAVRSLEQRGISIQNVSIVDEAQRIWRKSNPGWARRSRAQNARRAFLFGAVVSLVAAQLALRAYLFWAGQPLETGLTWALLCGTSLLGGCMNALLGVRRGAKRPRRRAHFSVILRSNLATLATVAQFFPRVQKPGPNSRFGFARMRTRARRPAGSLRAGQ